LPQVAAMAHVVALLAHQAADAQVQQLAGVLHRDRIVELLPAEAGLGRLDVEEGGLALDPDPDRGLLPATGQHVQVVEVALGHGLGAFPRRAPAVAGQQELAFDLHAHGGATPGLGGDMMPATASGGAAWPPGSWTLRARFVYYTRCPCFRTPD